TDCACNVPCVSVCARRSFAQGRKAMATAARRLLAVLGIVCVGALPASAARANPPFKKTRDTAKSAEAVRPGIVIVIGGVGGCDILPHSTRFVLPRSGLPHEVRDFVWTHGVGQVLKD